MRLSCAIFLPGPNLSPVLSQISPALDALSGGTCDSLLRSTARSCHGSASGARPRGSDGAVRFSVLHRAKVRNLRNISSAVASALCGEGYASKCTATVSTGSSRRCAGRFAVQQWVDVARLVRRHGTTCVGSGGTRPATGPWPTPRTGALGQGLALRPESFCERRPLRGQRRPALRGAARRKGMAMPASGSFQISGYTLSAMSKILVSVDDKLLARIDRAASSAGLSRSAYLARLAARELGEERVPGASRQAQRALARLQKLFDAQPSAEEATAAVRAGRDAR